MKYFVRSSLFPLKTTPQNFYNCSQHERVLKILYFHIFNIAKFGKIYVWTITNWTTSWSWKQNTSWFCLRMLKNNLSRCWFFYLPWHQRGTWFSQDWGRGFGLSYPLFANNLLSYRLFTNNLPTSTVLRSSFKYLHPEN